MVIEQAIKVPETQKQQFLQIGLDGETGFHIEAMNSAGLLLGSVNKDLVVSAGPENKGDVVDIIFGTTVSGNALRITYKTEEGQIIIPKSLAVNGDVSIGNSAISLQMPQGTFENVDSIKLPAMIALEGIQLICANLFKTDPFAVEVSSVLHGINRLPGHMDNVWKFAAGEKSFGIDFDPPLKIRAMSFSEKNNTTVYSLGSEDLISFFKRVSKIGE